MNMNLNPVNAAAQAMSAPAESAQGLASLGRNNDTMLMHVTPNEVQGLQQLAQNMGGSLTRNPQTGLPEAGFFDFLGSLIPTIAGLGVGAVTGSPQLAGLAAGGAKTIQTGDLGAGILSGFGAYMGADTLKGVGDFGANAAANTATDVAADTASSFVPTPAQIADNPTGFANAAALNSASVPAQTVTDMGTSNYYGAPTDVAAADLAKQTAANQSQFGSMLNPTLGETASNIGAGFSQMTQPGGFDAYAQSIGKSPMAAGFGLASPMVGPALEAMAPPPMSMEEEDSGWGPFKSIADRRKENTMMASGGPVLDDGTGLAGLLDKRVGNEGEGQGNAEYFAAGGLKEGAFILPADVVSHYGNGSSKAGLAVLAKKLNAKPIHGPGDGMSDDIPTTIEGKQKARVADGEAYISPADVKRVGGPKKLYAMMDKIRQARTGTAKQGKQINPAKYLPS